MSQNKLTLNSIIRRELIGDEKQIRKVNELAFGQEEEANIIDALRKNCSEGISLVAKMNTEIVGHILFTPAVIESDKNIIRGMGLAPMSVLPAYQNKGIGSKLVREGLEIVKANKTPFVIVLGHPNYYPRSGFEKASKYQIKSEYEGVPDEAFMILILDEEKMRGISGIAKYRKEFYAAI